MTAEGPVGAAAGWLALAAGAIGVVVTGLVYALRGRFRGGTLGKGFGLWTLAIFLWAASML